MKHSGKNIVLLISMGVCAALVWGCVESGARMNGAAGVQTLKQQEALGVQTNERVEVEIPAPQQVEVAAPQPEPKPVPAAQPVVQKAPAGGSPYELDLQPLATSECGRCHFSVFTAIKDEGGKHQLDCTFCHEEFHTYKPGRNWAEVVPACNTCHGAAHGSNYLECLACHANAHAPVASMVNLGALEPDCAKCHEPQGRELAQNPSAHTDLSCSSCHHTSHGNIPDCIECHAQPHVAFEANSGCVGCHPVHSPTNIEYGEQVRNNVCSGCHASVNTKLVNSQKKHSALTCVYCHENKHGYVPACQNCHGKPHSDALLSRFNGCTDCHGEPHALILPGH